MRAIVFQEYGDPKEVMKLKENIEIPKPKENEILVKVESSSINAADKYMVRANYFIIRLIFGLFRPTKKRRILGVDIAGTVQELGANVDGFQIGDAVVADIRKSYGGGFAEFVVVNVNALVKKPGNISFEQAASVPISGQAAMMGLTHCNIKSGDRVLINGASGGVGSFGVQIAKAKGAHVTAICSGSKADAVKAWGADEIIDYEKTSVTDLKMKSFDAVFDTACFGSPSKYSKILKDDGRYVLVGGSYYEMLRVKNFGRFYAQGRQEFKAVTQDVAVTTNIKEVLRMISQNKIKPAIQKVVLLEDVPNAIHSLEQRVVVGKIVVNNQR